MKPPPEVFTNTRPLTSPRSTRSSRPASSTCDGWRRPPRDAERRREIVAGAQRDDAEVHPIERPGGREAVDGLVQGAVAAGDEQASQPSAAARRGALRHRRRRGDARPRPRRSARVSAASAPRRGRPRSRPDDGLRISSAGAGHTSFPTGPRSRFRSSGARPNCVAIRGWFPPGASAPGRPPRSPPAVSVPASMRRIAWRSSSWRMNSTSVSTSLATERRTSSGSAFQRGGAAGGEPLELRAQRSSSSTSTLASFATARAHVAPSPAPGGRISRCASSSSFAQA